MTKQLLVLGAALALLCSCAARRPAADPASYVDPSIGTSFTGHTFIGACYPFGLVQPSPDSGNDGWGYCSGYRFEDKSFMGFSQTHLSGTGVGDLGDLLVQPFIGEVRSETNYYECAVKKETETCSPGYYGIELERFPVKVEATCSEHVSFYRFSYGTPEAARLMIDFQTCLGGDIYERVDRHEIAFPDEYTVTGFTHKWGWRTGSYGFVIKFSKPVLGRTELAKRKDKHGEDEKAGRIAFDFGPLEGEPLLMKIALSTVSAEGAAANMAAEVPGWDFDGTQAACRGEWNKYLSRVNVTKGTDTQKRNFFTAVYHMCVQPNNIADVDGRFRGCDDKVYQSRGGRFYSTLSTWDTFRAAHPLYTIIAPELVDAFVNTMIDQQQIKGWMPIWTLWGDDNQCMIGTHSIPVVVDAWLKGFKGFDPKEAWSAIRNTLREKHDRARESWDLLDKYGYYPCDKWSESASCTLEFAYDDWCALQMAKKLGTEEDVAYFGKRCQNWRNVIDTSLGLARAKDSNGRWREPFDPNKVGGDFTEGSAWQYTWHVMQDPYALIDLIGGREKALKQLEGLFDQPAQEGRLLDVTGLIGEYSHGNEPSHHVAYFFQFLGRPDRTADIVREVFDRFYLDKPDGLCGNDDCGQMSAWYVFSAAGFYPFNPCGGEYVLGAPQIEQIVLTVPGGKTLTVTANNLSEKNKHVKSVSLNGKPVTGFTLTHEQLVAGGDLVFEMCE